jgi:hypothetical protein
MAVKNITLNPGGVIGAALLVAAVVTVVLLTASGNVGGHIGRFGVLALFLGAFGGNYLWERLFTKRE